MIPVVHRGYDLLITIAFSIQRLDHVQLARQPSRNRPLPRVYLLRFLVLNMIRPPFVLICAIWRRA